MAMRKFRCKYCGRFVATANPPLRGYCSYNPRGHVWVRCWS